MGRKVLIGACFLIVTISILAISSSVINPGGSNIFSVIKAFDSNGITFQNSNGLPFFSMGAGPGIDAYVIGDFSIGLNQNSYIRMAGSQANSPVTMTIYGTAPAADISFVPLGTGTVVVPALVFQGSTPPPNSQALCLLAGQVGHCTTIVGAGGGCTCVVP